MAGVSEGDEEDGVVAASMLLNWTICSAAHSEMYRRSSAAQSTIDAVVLAMMLCGSNATFAASDIVTVVNLGQFANARLPMDVTLSGIVMDVNPAHSLKALLPIDVTLSGIMMDVNAAHP